MADMDKYNRISEQLGGVLDTAKDAKAKLDVYTSNLKDGLKSYKEAYGVNLDGDNLESIQANIAEERDSIDAERTRVAERATKIIELAQAEDWDGITRLGKNSKKAVNLSSSDTGFSVTDALEADSDENVEETATETSKSARASRGSRSVSTAEEDVETLPVAGIGDGGAVAEPAGEAVPSEVGDDEVPDVEEEAPEEVEEEPEEGESSPKLSSSKMRFVDTIMNAKSTTKPRAAAKKVKEEPEEEPSLDDFDFGSMI